MSQLALIITECGPKVSALTVYSSLVINFFVTTELYPFINQRHRRKPVVVDKRIAALLRRTLEHYIFYSFKSANAKHMQQPRD